MSASRTIEIVNDAALLAEVRQAVADTARDGGFPGEQVNRLMIAVDEAVANIIEHGFDGAPAGSQRIRITIDASPAQFRIEIADHGHAFDPSTSKDIDMAAHVASGRSGGLGVFLIRKIMDVVDYHGEQGTNRLVMVKRA